MSRYSPGRLALLLAGCVVLGLGVGLLLVADLGSDGYSTLVNGIARSGDWAFVVANIAVSVVFLAVAALRRVRPDIGTLVQIVVVGYTVEGDDVTGLVVARVEGDELRYAGTVKPNLTAEEKAMLEKSAASVRGIVDVVKKSA